MDCFAMPKRSLASPTGLWAMGVAAPAVLALPSQAVARNCLAGELQRGAGRSVTERMTPAGNASAPLLAEPRSKGRGHQRSYGRAASQCTGRNGNIVAGPRSEEHTSE